MYFYIHPSAVLTHLLIEPNMFLVSSVIQESLHLNWNGEVEEIK